MEKDTILQQLVSWRDANKRPAWKPMVEAEDGSVTDSKFSGTPWLVEGEAYPCCGACQALMPLFLQLNLADLPDEVKGRFGTGLLQLFYCIDEDCEADGWKPFSENKLVRLVQPDDRPPASPPDGFPSFPPVRIVGWTRLDDYPNSQEFEDLGLTFAYDFSKMTAQIECSSVGLTVDALPMESLPDAEDIAIAAAGDKLAGYPLWVQGKEYPNCPECDRQMELVFQLDSEDNLPFMFGDVGCGHITQCPDHKTIVAFGWACG